jgi:hypothetical protein
MIKIDRKELLSQLDIISPGLAPRDIVEQSSCVVFKDGYVMTFNDEIACRMETNLNLTGAITASALIETLRKMSEDIVEVEIKDEEIIIHGKRRKIGIAREATILLPIDSLDTTDEWHPLPEQFSDAADMVLPCCGKDEQRFNLTCIHLYRRGIDASDNMQYGHYKIKLPLSEDVLIRAASMRHVVPMGVTEIAVTPSWAHFRNSRGLIISCRRWPDTWEDYSAFTSQTGTPAKFPKALSKAAELAGGISNQNADDTQVTVSIKQGRLKLTATGVRCWSEELKKIEYDGEPMSFKIDPVLLSKICKEHNSLEIGANAIIVRSNKFTYVTALGACDGEG